MMIREEIGEVVGPIEGWPPAVLLGTMSMECKPTVLMVAALANAVAEGCPRAVARWSADGKVLEFWSGPEIPVEGDSASLGASFAGQAQGGEGEVGDLRSPEGLGPDFAKATAGTQETGPIEEDTDLHGLTRTATDKGKGVADE